MLGGLEERADWVPARDIRPNTWNPNRMTEVQFRAAYHSLRLHGFKAPIVVRKAKPIDRGEVSKIMDRLAKRAHLLKARVEELGSAQYEIVDGEHRWVAAQAIARDIEEGRLIIDQGARRTKAGWVTASGTPLPANKIAADIAETIVRGGETFVFAVDIGEVGDTEAKRLTIVLNETRGSAEKTALGDVLRVIEGEVGDIHAATIEMPFSQVEIDDILASADEFDVDAYIDSLGVEGEELKRVSFKVPLEAEGVINDTLDRIASDLGIRRSPATLGKIIAELARRYTGQ